MDSSPTSPTSEVVYTPPSSTSSTSPATTVNPIAAANISIREYIYFLPYPLPPNTPVPYSTHLPHFNPLHLPSTTFEPTSTLVLTSPLNTFVDLRFLLPVQENETPLPLTGEKKRLEWGFAGTSSSAPIPGRDGVTHSTWTHWLDSRHAAGAPNIPVDEGDMYAISRIRTLEHGNAFHPHLKAVKSHEEMWRDEDVRSVTDDAMACVVLRLQNDERGVRGVVVRLGQYVQGIMMVGKEVTCERWEFGDEGWKRSARVGDMLVPCGVTMKGEAMHVGGKVTYAGWEWWVEEAWEAI